MTIKKSWMLMFLHFALLLTLTGAVWAQGSLYFFPQVADGFNGGNFFFTQFFFNNPSTRSVTVTMTFRTPSGVPWNIDFRVFSPPPNYNRSNGVVTFTLDAKTTIHFFTGGVVPLATGWCEVQTSGPLEVSESFDLVNRSSFQLISESGVLPGPLSTQFSFDADVSSGFALTGLITNTGLAIANPSADSAATVTATLLDANGNQVSQKTINLGAHGQTALFLNSLFSDALPSTITGVFNGIARLSSNVNVAVLALRDNFVNGGEEYSSLAVNSDFSLDYNINYDVESNNDFGTAETITPPARIIGTMNSPAGSADEDFFAVNLTAGQTLSVFGVADILGSPLDGVIEIFDPNQNLVALNNNISTGLNDSFLSFTAPTTGTYFIEEADTSGSWGRGSYYELLVRVK